jgi:branched-chain amino acid transport system ATP-binding protein
MKRCPERRGSATKPRILLIDEMSLSLDPVVFLRLMPIAQSIAESGVGVLLVEQFTQLALGLARDAVVVAGGQVCFQGTSEALTADPALLHRAYLGGGAHPVGRIR